MSEEPENLVLALLRDMRGDIVELRSDMHSLRADVASDIIELEKRLNAHIIDLEKRLNAQFAGLRRAVMEYHSSAIGHGVLISEFEERLRRIEKRLDITPDTH